MIIWTPRYTVYSRSMYLTKNNRWSLWIS